MLSGWHVSHLPVKLVGSMRKWQVIDQVVVSWEELEIEGFLLMPRPFYIPFVPSSAVFQLSGMGLVLPDPRQISRRSRSWRRKVMKRQRVWMGLAVFDEGGRLLGRVQDVLFDEETLQITHVVISRGLLGDLLWGALAVSRQDVIELAPSAIKIRAARAPFTVRPSSVPD